MASKAVKAAFTRLAQESPEACFFGLPPEEPFEAPLRLGLEDLGELFSGSAGRRPELEPTLLRGFRWLPFSGDMLLDLDVGEAASEKSGEPERLLLRRLCV
mmetsp:Transcript_70813/g.207503  ORF Transcript_70813/g.207503 Transcript_70813/m.207503 type:complete len:101 (+) Transcript_70813:825-1127(+)